MRILISGICGFVGSTIALALREHSANNIISGFDNFVRPGSELNRVRLRRAGIAVQHVDLRCASDMENLAPVEWVIDAAANPSVLAGVSGLTSSRQLLEHNLFGTVNLLEYCKRHRAGFILLSTSRVYSIGALKNLKLKVEQNAYALDSGETLPVGVSSAGINEDFPTSPPLSIYGSSKLASEQLALEYGAAFNFPVWINRCGVLAGAGQFGRADQGIFTFWIHAWLRNRPLQYVGFDGRGHQVRNCLHPRDLTTVLQKQMSILPDGEQIFNFSGGAANSMSLAQLSEWCAARFDAREIAGEARERAFDVPWLVLDAARASAKWNWKPATPIADVLDEISAHAREHPE